MRACDREDLAQEKLLAELEGRAFDARAFSRSYLRHSEIVCADVESVQVQVPRSKQKRPVGTFEAQSAAYRDDALREFLSGLLTRGLTQVQIAAELTKRRAPKATWRNKHGWQKWGARELLRRQGLGVGQTEGRRMGGRAAAISQRGKLRIIRERSPSSLCVRICELRLNAWSYRDISEHLSISYRCISRSVNRGIGDEGKQERYRVRGTTSYAQPSTAR